MTLLEKENAIRKLLGKPKLAAIYDGCGYMSHDDYKHNRFVVMYYGEVLSIGAVLRDVVPRLAASMQIDADDFEVCMWAEGSGHIDEHKYGPRRTIIGWPDLASMPAACCDALLLKEGLLT